MAASAVYVNLTAVPVSSKSATENVAFSNIGSTFGTVTLQRLGPDASTWQTAATAVAASAALLAPIYLPPGQYRVAIA